MLPIGHYQNLTFLTVNQDATKPTYNMKKLILLLFIFSNFSVYAQGSYDWDEHINAMDSIDWGSAFNGILILVFIVWIINLVSEGGLRNVDTKKEYKQPKKAYKVIAKKKTKEDIKTEKKKVITDIDLIKAYERDLQHPREMLAKGKMFAKEMELFKKKQKTERDSLLKLELINSKIVKKQELIDKMAINKMVEHSKYGIGTVINLTPSKKFAKILFKDGLEVRIKSSDLKVL